MNEFERLETEQLNKEKARVYSFELAGLIVNDNKTIKIQNGFDVKYFTFADAVDMAFQDDETAYLAIFYKAQEGIDVGKDLLSEAREKMADWIAQYLKQDSEVVEL